MSDYCSLDLRIKPFVYSFSLFRAVMIWYDVIDDMIWYDMIVNCNWVAIQWQQYSTHLHTNSTQNDTKQTIHRTTQKFWKSAGHVPSWQVLPWHLPYNWGKTQKNLSQGKWRVLAGTKKIHKHAIRIHRHKNKNTLTLLVLALHTVRMREVRAWFCENC